MNKNKELGLNIKKVRQLRGVSRKELADTLGCSPYAIEKYEQGQRSLRIDILQKIATALQVPISLLTRPEKKITNMGMEVTPNWDLIEKEYLNDGSAEYYKKELERVENSHMEMIASLILQLKKDSISLNQRINEYEEYLSLLLEGSSYTLDTFLNKINDEMDLADSIIINSNKNNNGDSNGK